MKKILFVASEGLPFVKTGGLADVIGSLPQALHREGYHTSVVLPLYLNTAKTERMSLTKLKTFKIKVGGLNTIATVYFKTIEEIDYYLIEHAAYFERENCYG